MCVLTRSILSLVRTVAGLLRRKLPAGETTRAAMDPARLSHSPPHQYCTADSGIPEFSGAQIEALLEEYNPSLLQYMRTYYLDNAGNNPSFWEHEVGGMWVRCASPTS